MKVCTDACILGAWLANKFTVIPVNSILDIGAGTGLLSLMIAQKNNVIIDALEIETNAFEQCKENFQHSPWNKNLNTLHIDAKDFNSQKKYDLIISNPPFFENDLLSTDKNKNIAKHNQGLNIETLLSVIKQNLSDAGFFAVLLPFSRIANFVKLAAHNNFHLSEKILIRQTAAHNFFRGILLFHSKKETVKHSELIIKNADASYTVPFVQLLSDYYLHL